MSYDHVLAIGFGAPTAPNEIEPFLKIVSKGRPIPSERLKEVSHHYELIGGSSPYNAQCFEFIEKLQKQLANDGLELPVFVGMRNWNPFMSETQKQIKERGFKKGLVILLAPHRSEASCSRYKKDLSMAQTEAGTESIEYDFMNAWYEEPLYIQAHVEEIERILPSNLQDTAIVFTAHSIPIEMSESCQECDYALEFKATGNLIAEKLGLKEWHFAYQSRSGNPRQPWLEPDILDVIGQFVESGKKTMLIVPIGFLCENAEILFDLDIEAKEALVKHGMNYLRPKTVMTHMQFIQMMSQKIKNQLLNTVN